MVRAVIVTQLEDLSVQMTTAGTLVQTYLSDQGLPSALLDTIETWVAAHYVAITDTRIKSGQGLDYRAEFQAGELGMSLEYTPWGQTALALDPTGKLAEIGSGSAGAGSDGPGGRPTAAIITFL
jgi:hypothetical protein